MIALPSRACPPQYGVHGRGARDYGFHGIGGIAMRYLTLSWACAACLFLLGCDPRLTALTAAPPTAVAELDTTDDLMRLSQGIALAVECTAYTGGPCEDATATSADTKIAAVGVRPRRRRARRHDRLDPLGRRGRRGARLPRTLNDRYGRLFTFVESLRFGRSAARRS
jgi:hypothetical protein